MGRIERSWRWGKRNPLVAGLIGFIAATISVALTLIIWQWREAVAARIDERIATQDAIAKRVHAEEARALAERETLKARRNAYQADMLLALEASELGNRKRVIELLRRHWPSPGQPDLRQFEWYYLWRNCNKAQLALRGHYIPVWQVAFSPDGRWLVSCAGLVADEG